MILLKIKRDKKSQHIITLYFIHTGNGRRVNLHNCYCSTRPLQNVQFCSGSGKAQELGERGHYARILVYGPKPVWLIQNILTTHGKTQFGF